MFIGKLVSPATRGMSRSSRRRWWADRCEVRWIGSQRPDWGLVRVAHV